MPMPLFPQVARCALIALLLVLAAGCASRGKVQKGPAAVDLPRFMGTWHVVAHSPYFAERGHVAARYEYAFRDRDKVKKREREFRFPTHITFDNEGSEIYTIIEVDTRDRPGLLFDLTRTLATSHIYIASAVIATYGKQVVDSFYVKDMFGLKLHAKSKQEALDRKLRGTSLYRSVFFYPVMVPSVAAGMVWVFLYAPGYGPINGLMELLGLPKLEWLYDRQWALPAIIFMSIWKYAGYFMLILLAALQLVPRDLYEAARLDGVSGFRQLVHITVPLISPTLYFVVIIGVLHSYQIFDYVFVMTQGGPADATNVLTFYIYQNAFQFQDIGTASAIANILLLVVMGLIGLVALTLGRRVHYMGR